MAVVQIQSPPITHYKPNSASISSPTANAAVVLRRPSLKSSFFFSVPLRQLVASGRPESARFSMRVASNSKQAYICRDCGYIYNERIPFDKKPDSYFCPGVCGAPKRRFRSYEPAVTKDANDLDVRKARKAQIQRDESIGRALPFAIVIGVAALAGLYFYLNSAY